MKALKIVRFCYPGMTRGSSVLARDWNPNDRDDVADAERVLIERGLAEEYGEALSKEARVVADPKQFEATIFRILSAVRTLPLDVIIRAMVRVIEAREEKK